MNVVVLDYGAGNVASVVKGLVAAGGAATVTSEPSLIERAPAIVVPGVGHFDRTSAIGRPQCGAVALALERGAALLGICLGLQWLFEGSEESRTTHGIGVFSGRCTELPGAPGLKVPHVGWNSLERTDSPSRLLAGIPPGASMYFTHSFSAPVIDETTATVTHGRQFSAVVERGRIFGTQCHPEKSGGPGLQMLRTFIQIARDGYPHAL